MSRLQIVTDSGARWTPSRALQQLPVTVVPYKLEVGTQQYREGTDLNSEEVLHLLRSARSPMRLVPPSVADYLGVYGRLSQGCDGIISIHTSRDITKSWEYARQAAHQMGEAVPIAVVDSQTICAGQSMLVELAGQAAVQQLPFDQAVQQVRSAVDRIYSTYYVESLEFLQRNQILSEAHSILGSMLNIKPLVSVEGGVAVVTEKVRTRSQAIDRLVEFIAEFDELQEAVIVQNRVHITEQTRLLQDRLALEFPGRHFPYRMYGMALAMLLGYDAVGAVVLE